MRIIIAILLAAAIPGCATGPRFPNDPVAAQCDYESDIAIQSIPNALYAGFRKAELFGMCMRARGR